MIIKNLFKKSDFGLVVDWNRFRNNGFYSATTPYLIDDIIRVFNPIILTSQEDYNKNKQQLKSILSMELGVPQIKFDIRIKCKKGLIHSDPHYQVEKRARYFLENEFDFMLSFYNYPFFYHNPDFDRKKFIHFPWAVPDKMVYRGEIEVRSQDLAIFGGKESDAYDIRNWCRNQEGIINFENSGVENKNIENSNYFLWLRQFNAIIAAGSSNPIYDLVTPKYFEIASSGALLFGQYCKDLQLLGFNDSNCIIFSKMNFLEKVSSFRRNPNQYLEIRERGRNLILQKHKISDRINLLKDLFNGSKADE
jgi:hypothetical protein